MFYLGRCPLDRLIGTQMAKAPRVRMVAVQIMPGTLIAPMLSLMPYNKKSSNLSSNHALNTDYLLNGGERVAASVSEMRREFCCGEDCVWSDGNETVQ